jgi:hypothetical protein
MAENKCPHLEVKYYALRETEMGKQGMSYRGPGWYCVWCKQPFAPMEGETHGAESKRAK